VGCNNHLFILATTVDYITIEDDDVPNAEALRVEGDDEISTLGGGHPEVQLRGDVR
jgi:hypothetical protein